MSGISRLLTGCTQGACVVCALLGGALLVAGAMADRADFFRAYLIAYVFWIGITMGCFTILMLHHLAGGVWGLLLRRIMEAATMTSPLMAILLLPLAAGLPVLYPWARPDAVAGDLALQNKSVYLNVPFFLGRSLLYIVIWNFMIFRARRWSYQEEQSPGPEWAPRLRRFGAIALVVFGLTVTFAAVDYLMSLEPRWFSAVYSAMVASGAVLSAFAFAMLVLALLQRDEPLASLVNPQVLNDLGNLLLAFIMVWAYLSYSQFLIIWSGNLSNEITWYQRRLAGGWEWLALAMVVANFVLPFSLLLVRDLKRNVRVLGALAAWLVLSRWLDVFWLIKPAFAEGFSINGLDVVATITIGAVWLAAFTWLLARRPLLPEHDPRLVAASQLARKAGQRSEAI
jgi:hypothetical protein